MRVATAYRAGCLGDLLFLNAGVMDSPPGTAEVGLDIQLGTNQVGHFLLTKMLLPRLMHTVRNFNVNARILSTAPTGHLSATTFETMTSIEELSMRG